MKKLFFLLVLIVSAAMIHAQSANSNDLYILFPANSAKLQDVRAEQAIRNTQIFIKVAELLMSNRQNRILIDGHANPVERTALEEAETLRPLSLQRAEAAADFLVDYYHIDRQRIIVTGAGGGFPSANNNSSLNRRVNFILIPPR